MNARRWLFLFAILGLLTCAAIGTLRIDAPSSEDDLTALSAEDRAYLDALIKDFLFDPRGAERVAVKVPVRSVWAATGEVMAEGWLRRGNGNQPARVYFTDGWSIPAPPEKERKKVDFKATCRARYAAAEDGNEGREQDHDDGSRELRPDSIEFVTDVDLALAAWLHRLGDDTLASQALAAAREEEDDPREQLRDSLAWSAYAGLIHAYMVRADQEALEHGERLMRLYADTTKSTAETERAQYDQAPLVIAELKRRAKQGTFGKEPPDAPPEGFDSWDANKKARFLIDALDEVDARQWGQPGGVDLGSDWRVEALIALGDAAVPLLIEAVEKDERLTRSVHFWRDFAPSRTVLGVREAALTAVMSILRVRIFDPVSTGDNFTARGVRGQDQAVAQLRAYWNTYGGMPYADRMMAVIVDPRARPEATREAAANLGSMGEHRVINTTVFTDHADGRRDTPNPAVMKFRAPTAAEAMLAAMDRDLAQHDSQPDQPLYEYDRRHFEDAYVFPIVELGDPRIVGELVKRIASERRARMKFKYAFACHALHQSGPLKELAAQLAAGEITVPPNKAPDGYDDEQPGNRDMRTILGLLLDSHLEEASQAIYAAADPAHALYPLLSHRAMHAARTSWRGNDPVWFRHPSCLELIGHQLNNAETTGRWSSTRMRDRDEAAERLGWLMITAPRYNFESKDADTLRGEIGTLLQRFHRRWRVPTRFEAAALHLSPSDPLFLPDIKPLTRPATAEDVTAGRAIFHLEGSTLSPDTLPLRVVLKTPRWKAESHHSGEDDGDPTCGIAVQAEVGSDGQTYYGVIMRRGLFRVSADELQSHEPLDSREEE